MNAPRRLLNTMDRWLDRGSLRAVTEADESWPGGGVPALASHALERVFHVAQRFDTDPRLKRVEAPQGVAADGAARRWTFDFELPTARATLHGDWLLDGDLQAGRFGRERLRTRATPFPAPGTELAEGLAAGRVAYGLLATIWREQRRLTPDLPLVFRDSDAVIADLRAQGLPVERVAFVLRSDPASGSRPSWLAEGGGAVYRCRFG